MTPRRSEPNVHGGDLDAARSAYPDAPGPWIDLSTGINPHPYPVLEQDVTAWARLPQPSQENALRQAAARRYRADDADMVVAAPGTQALIQIIPHLVAPSRVAIVSPTYSEHATAWRRARHEIVAVSDLSEARRAQVVVVVNPNNPTGHVTPVCALRELATTLHERGGLLVVDEAFADVLPDQTSVIPKLPPATIALRSFGKTYGLPGLRLGFAIAHKDMAAQLRDHLGPWCVSVPAISIATSALADDRWLQTTIDTLQRGARRLDALLASCRCTLVGGTPLFRLVTHPTAHRIADTLRPPRHPRPALGAQPTWLRFGLPGADEDWERLSRALLAATDEATASPA